VPQVRFWTSADPCEAEAVIGSLWGEPVSASPLPERFRRDPDADE
jgi:hypothetical protein